MNRGAICSQNYHGLCPVIGSKTAMRVWVVFILIGEEAD